MFLDTMPLKVFEVWSRAWTTAFTSSVQAATVFGQSLDALATHQRDEWNRSVSTAAAELRHTWTYLNPYHRLQHGRRVALVTGGTGGIGTAICLRLADAGFLVIATYPRHESPAARQWQAARRRAGYELGIVACDVARCDDCANMASWIEGHYGHVDILVNCVGITRDDRKQENWQTVLDTNLDSVFNVTRTVIAAMAERHFGRIINISSVNGPSGQFRQTDVAAAKAGMLGFTKSLARELADQGITVNTVSPGHGAGMVVEIPDEIRKAIKAKLAKGRWGEPEEIAAAVDFLAADTSGYITGIDIAVNDRRLTA
ncbi:MAG: Acetoacetyl-CoA reductase [Chromatiales bacterium USCg_Taylor]|nr:MAG: Acetoacetyl-CoA reductase [Chromatiales bacterium USCg_Taylor]